VASTAMRLRARGIEKRFPGVRALAGVDLSLAGGEVLAVVGENGAGKSTLMNILAGVMQPDGGSVEVEDRALHFAGVHDAQKAGIALIHQELCLCERLDVVSNVCLGRETRRLGLLDRRRNEDRARRALARVGLDLDPSTPVGELAIGQRQMVEIAKAVDADARVLIMDEPSSSLSLAESERLFALVGELAAGGTSVVYISHRLGEVERLADRALVLRDGSVAGELERDEIEHDRLVRLMVGRDVSRFFSRSAHEPGRVVLQVQGLVTRAHPEHAVDLSVREGEVVGIAGLVGAGRSELLRALFMIDRPLAGSSTVLGTALDLQGVGGPGAALAAGLALVPEDRKEEGLFLAESVRRNLSIVRLADDALRGFVDRAAERELAARAIRETRIKTTRDDEAVDVLSGGNQQKVVLGRAFAAQPKVLCLDEPTRGVDVGAKADIYALIDEHARRGMGVLFASSEMEEILGLADRCIVLHEGRIAGELGREELSEEAVMSLATGAERAA
jgi:ribose transport system ATP-binding protein